MNRQPNDTGFQLLIMTFLALSLLLVSNSNGETRIKDVTTIEGLSGEKLIGYGLVVGLSGTGDGWRAKFTTQSLANMLERLGINIDDRMLRVENVAAVMATADMGAFSGIGGKLDVTVSSLGDATSLEGGTLLLTPLKAANGVVYAAAQGAVITGGFTVNAGPGTSVSNNLTTVGSVISGAVIKKELRKPFVRDGVIRLSLVEPDFQTMSSMLEAINGTFGADVAEGLDARNVLLKVPDNQSNAVVSFIARVGQLPIVVDVAARVVINEKTGTIVIGRGVEVGEAAIAHGNLRVEVNTQFDATQPLPFSDGNTLVVPEVTAYVEDNEARIFAVPESSTVGDIAQALNEIGVTPRDIIAIFQALKRAGALRGELVII